ncbi:MAG: hypothetical protein Q8S18_12125 [Bacteroidales bacterium]|nr:hypothetical protein [Bacteroidales bacterium]
MINLVVVSDDRNIELGFYFSKCSENIVDFFNDNNSKLNGNVIHISSNNCNQCFIDLEISKLNSAPFVFIAYSHGDETSLRCSGNTYVKSGLNTEKFNKSLFYTNSCLTGKELGKDLVENGCTAFIGYEEETYSFYNKDYIDTLVNCDNSGITTFFLENISIDVAYKRMKNYYTNKIDKYIEIDPFFASYLVKYREALVLYGRTDLVKDDLNI